MSHGEQGLAAILHDPEIQLVMVVLPAQALGVRESLTTALTHARRISHSGMASLPQQPGVSHSCLPQVVKQALAAGKHVIEEKPIALTFEDAVPLIRHYRSMQQAAASDGGGPSPLWMLAENYRYEQVFSEASAMAPALIGTVIKMDLVVNLQMDVNNK